MRTVRRRSVVSGRNRMFFVEKFYVLRTVRQLLAGNITLTGYEVLVFLKFICQGC